MHFDWTFTLGNLLMLVFGALPILAVVVKTYWLLKEYPPHRHVGNVIVYPAGTRPEHMGHK